MTLLGDGRVLVTGGVSGDMDHLVKLTDIDTVEIYDPATGRFTTTGKMTTPRAEHVAVLLP